MISQRCEYRPALVLALVATMIAIEGKLDAEIRSVEKT
jgi:hypothetical protein